VVVAELANAETARIPYDMLVVAGGSLYSYFGHEDWRQFAALVDSAPGGSDLAWASVPGDA
jgi:NADH dehydrogenase FAD-containing subunit